MQTQADKVHAMLKRARRLSSRRIYLRDDHSRFWASWVGQRFPWNRNRRPKRKTEAK